ncbi:MAG TPA: four helix bundle protein [Anaerolineae bacterium]|nr:four helix bundle protein [Anaerolineae bacterium]
MSEGEKEYQSLDDLVAWQKARALGVFVHKQIVPMLPVEEKWDLASQIRRASKSVMANIAEGHGRYYYQENIRFCYLGSGSLMETYSHLTTAHDLNYISDELFAKGNSLFLETRRTLSGYVAYLKKSKRGGDLPGGCLKEPAIDYALSFLPDEL